LLPKTPKPRRLIIKRMESSAGRALVNNSGMS